MSSKGMQCSNCKRKCTAPQAPQIRLKSILAGRKFACQMAPSGHAEYPQAFVGHDASLFDESHLAGLVEATKPRYRFGRPLHRDDQLPSVAGRHTLEMDNNSRVSGYRS